MSLYQKFVTNQQLRRVVVLLTLIGVIYVSRSMMNIIFADVHLYFFSDSISTKGPTVFKNSARSCGCAALYVGDFFSVSSSNDLCATDC